MKTCDVAVIGGGPAGMKAALTADRRGHQVTLLEQNSSLGGALTIFNQEPHKLDLRRYRDYLIEQIAKSGVNVRLNTKATPELVKNLNPDHLILALGGKWAIPPIPGIERGLTPAQAYTAGIPIGESVMILGGGAIGCELALRAAEAGCPVMLIEQGSQLHRKENQLVGLALDEHLKQWDNLTICLETTCLEINADSVVVMQRNEVRTIPTDVLVVCAGIKPLSQEADRFYGITCHTWKIGDVRRPGNIKAATLDGWMAGSQD